MVCFWGIFVGIYNFGFACRLYIGFVFGFFTIFTDETKKKNLSVKNINNYYPKFLVFRILRIITKITQISVKKILEIIIFIQLGIHIYGHFLIIFLSSVVNRIYTNKTVIFYRILYKNQSKP